MNKEKIIKNVINGIDDEILESGKAVVCLEDMMLEWIYRHKSVEGV